MNISRRAFTLVELSIVLVILGLLIGGVLAGQALIRSSELRSITTQYDSHVTAVHAFRDKYFALPGDMTNAQSYWGVAHATPATCATTPSTTASTCNGNGDQVVISTPDSAEIYRFWQHLANAGLITGTYSGVGIAAIASNSPAGKISSSLWYVESLGTKTGNNSLFDRVYGNTLEFGLPLDGTDPRTAVMRPEEAYGLDVKLDDGKPATGRVMARDVSGFNSGHCTDAADSSVLTAAYLLSNKALMCVPLFPQRF